MVIVLLFAAECQLGAFIKLVCISLSRNIHHYEVFSCSVKVVWTLHLLVIIVICIRVNAHITVISSLDGAIIESIYGEAH